MSISANRRKVAALLIVGLGTTLALGVSVTGNFRADIQTERGLAGPVRIGVDGGMGPSPAASASAELLPQQPRPENLVAAGGGSYPLTVTSAPYNGPTDEERALLHELRKATRASYARTLSEMPEDQRAMLASPPEIKLPPRHLTPTEKADIRNAIELLKGAR